MQKQLEMERERDRQNKIKAEQERQRQQQENARREHRDTTTNLTQWTLQVALLIFLGLGHDFSAGSEWLRQRRRRGSLLDDGITDSEAQRSSENDLLAVPVGLIASWQDHSRSHLSASISKAVDNFVRGHRLAQRVRQCEIHGSAMPVACVIARYSQVANSTDDFVQTFRTVPFPC